MTDAQVGDYVVIIIVVGALTIGLISMAIGYVVDAWDRFRAWRSVKHSQVVMSRPLTSAPPNKTDRPADRLSVSAQIERPPRLQLDKTREALIEELLTLGWTMTDFRREQIFRGDNNKISAEVEAARKRLGIESGERRTPIACRPTSAEFAPSLEYQPPPTKRSA